MNNKKIVGFYCFNDKDKEGNKIKSYCYVERDEDGKLSYHFLKDKAKADEILVKYMNDNRKKYETKETAIDRIVRDKDRFGYNCSSKEDVLNRIKKAHNEKVNEERFNEKYDKYLTGKKEINPDDSKKEGLRARFAKKYSNHKKGIKRVAYTLGLTALILATAFVGFKLNKKGPTATGTKNAITDNVDDLSDEKIEKQVPAQEQTATENTSTPVQRTNNTRTSSGNNNIPSNVTSTPGSINENYNEYQDPSQTLPDNKPSDPGTEDDKYENVIEDEEPVNDGNQDSSDGDYSEEIDVPADNEDNVNKDDVELDDKFDGNEGAVDDDLSYDQNGNETNSDLPDPNNTATAGNGDYNTTEEEMNESNQATNNSQSNETTEEVPTMQEQSTSTENTNITNQQLTNNEVPTTNEQTTTPSNEDVVSQAIEAMSNGKEVNILYNPETRTMSLENVESQATPEQTNSIAK